MWFNESHEVPVLRMVRPAKILKSVGIPIFQLQCLVSSICSHNGAESLHGSSVKTLGNSKLSSEHLRNVQKSVSRYTTVCRKPISKCSLIRLNAH